VKHESAKYLAKAHELLAEVADLDPVDKPAAVIHLSYYAMHHAAIAVLVEETGDAPRTHSQIVGQFGRLMKDKGAVARVHGKALSNALEARYVSDYGIGAQPLETDAKQAKAAAPAFVEFCERHIASIAKP